MQVERFPSGPVLITPKRFGDERGFFVELYNERSFEPHIGRQRFVQDNHSLSVPAGTVRGLHFQSSPAAQGKLVRVARGSVFDVAVDIRRDSPTYGTYVSTTLSAENGAQFWVPVGFAHGFCTLEPNTELTYKVTDYYSKENDLGLAWDDPDLGIPWPVDASAATLSAKDLAQPRLADLPAYF